MLKSNKLVFIIKVLILLIGSTSKSNFWQYVNCDIKGNLTDFEIEQLVFIMVLILLIGSASKSKFWQYFSCVIKGKLIDFEIGKKQVFIIKGLLFPNNKYHPNTKNYLRCLLIGGTFSIRGKGLACWNTYLRS